MTEIANYLLQKGWSIEEVREHLRSNYINSTCSAVEDAIRDALFDKGGYG